MQVLGRRNTTGPAQGDGQGLPLFEKYLNK